MFQAFRVLITGFTPRTDLKRTSRGEWDKAVLSLFASPSENLINVLPVRNKKVRGSYSNGIFFKMSCSWPLNGNPHSKNEKRRWLSPHSPTQKGREAWGRGYNWQDKETPCSCNKATRDLLWMQAINEQYWQWNLALKKPVRHIRVQ